jgi:hypothetical protein
LVVGDRETLEIPWASTLRAANPDSPNMLLYWKLLEYAVEAGYRRFDFGRSTPGEGTFAFKRQWGAEPVPLHWYYWLRDGGPLPELNPKNPKYQLAIRAWAATSGAPDPPHRTPPGQEPAVIFRIETPMCGIAGILHDDSAAPASPRLLGEMCDRIVHRGPDAFGQLVDGPVALGHRRLSIIDVGGGDQPIFNEDRSIAVVFNGEIYNHKALRQWLSGLGHHFRTNSDTEVLVHAYEHEGPEFVRRLRGMFAFALWDAPRRRLLIARDRLGKKPLYYTHQGGRLLFASELKAFARRQVPRPRARLRGPSATT